MYNLFYKSKIGLLEIKCDESHLIEVLLCTKKGNDNPNEICFETKNQLELYFNNKLKTFDLPIKLIGTDFQKEVWKKLDTIPFGKTISYQELANLIKKPKAVRAVANAVGKNKLLIIIPCHRIIGKDNSLTGFSAGLENKIFLLKHENFTVNFHKNIAKSTIK